MGNVSAVVYALLIPFTCGVAVQRLLAIFDALFQKAKPATKAWISALISSVVGLLVAWLADIRILAAIAGGINQPLSGTCPKCVDVMVTALVVSAGTEGFNSIIKFLGYAKEQTKATAAAKTQAAKTQGTKVDNADALNALHS